MFLPDFGLDIRWNKRSNADGLAKAVTGDEDPELVLAKIALGSGDPVAVGEDLTYRLTATNEGNQTLNNVQISDPMLPALTCTVGGVAAPAIVTLLPGEALICEGTYTADQDDIDAQTIDNAAAATSTNPQGVTVEDDATLSYPVEAADPDLDPASG